MFSLTYGLSSIISRNTGVVVTTYVLFFSHGSIVVDFSLDFDVGVKAKKDENVDEPPKIDMKDEEKKVNAIKGVVTEKITSVESTKLGENWDIANASITLVASSSPTTNITRKNTSTTSTKKVTQPTKPETEKPTVPRTKPTTAPTPKETMPAATTTTIVVTKKETPAPTTTTTTAAEPATEPTTTEKPTTTTVTTTESTYEAESTTVHEEWSTQTLPVIEGCRFDGMYFNCGFLAYNCSDSTELKTLICTEGYAVNMSKFTNPPVKEEVCTIPVMKEYTAEHEYEGESCPPERRYLLYSCDDYLLQGIRSIPVFDYLDKCCEEGQVFDNVIRKCVQLAD